MNPGRADPLRPQPDGACVRGARSLLNATLPLMAAALRRQREGGRAAASDALAGLLIEEGEAESLLAALQADLATAEPGADPGVRHGTHRHEGLVGTIIDRFALDATARIALALALGVEIDGRFARAVGYLNDQPARALPTLGLVWNVAGTPIGPERVALLQAPVVQDGVLELIGEGPLSTLEVRLAADLVPRILGRPNPCRPVRVTAAEPPADDEPIPAEAATWLDAVRAGVKLPLVLEGPPGSGRKRLALRLFSTLGLGTVTGSQDARLLRREARLNGAGIIAEPPEDLPAWWRTLAQAAGPIAVVVSPGRGEMLRASLPVEPVTLKLGVPDVGERTRLWRASAIGPRLGRVEAELLAARYPFTPGQVERAAARALLDPGTDGALDRVCRAVAATSFGSLARKLPRTFLREDLVLPEPLEQELELALSWVRHRRQVFGDWRLGRSRMNCWGLTMLLSGPPGTGKTMAAQVLAAELDSEIYRVDLSQVVSKYIGETEKQLDELLGAAYRAGAVLLFDEADVVFGRRSEVRDARDRYANLEVGFLLQRIEEHDGIVVLSTNRKGDMDEAFQRRFQFVLSFPLPDAGLRTRILERLLPAQACAADIDAPALAERFRLAGGGLRNAVVTAAFMAASQAVKIGQTHLLKALQREVLSSGRALRAEER